jgi:hypothetical protein
LGGQENILNDNPFIVRPHRFGRGLFATRRIKPGGRVLCFRGPLIDFARSRNPRFECYCVQVGPNSYTLTWAPERFINHSCEPNLGFRDARELRALRLIQPGEELTFDYSTSMAENAWTMECQCGAPQCRHLIGDFVDLPGGIKARYRELGIVPEWLSEDFEQQQVTARNAGGDSGQNPGNGYGNGHGKTVSDKTPSDETRVRYVVRIKRSWKRTGEYI